MHELTNSFRSFGKVVVWDRVKSTHVAVLIKVNVDALKDVPAGIIISADKNSGQSWMCSVVIIHENLLGGGPPEEYLIPIDGTPIPYQMKITTTLIETSSSVVFRCAQS